MKKLVLGLAVLGGMVFASAQEVKMQSSEKGLKKERHFKKGAFQHGKKNNFSHEDRLERIKKDLNLSDSQVSQLKALHEKNQKEREKGMEQMKIKAEARRKEHQEQMKSILTAEQYQKWQDNKLQKMQKQRQNSKSN